MNKETTHADTAQAPPGSEALTWRGWQAGAARGVAKHARGLTIMAVILAALFLAGIIAAAINLADASIFGGCNQGSFSRGTADAQCVQDEIDRLRWAMPVVAVAITLFVLAASLAGTMVTHRRRASKAQRAIAPDWRRLKDWYAGGGLPKERFRLLRTLMEPLHKGRPETLGGKAAAKMLLNGSVAFIAFAGLMTFFGFAFGWEGDSCRREYGNVVSLCTQLYTLGNQTMFIGWGTAVFGLVPLVLGLDLRIAAKRLHAQLEERIEYEEEQALHILSDHHREHGPLHLPDEDGEPVSAKRRKKGSPA